MIIAVRIAGQVGIRRTQKSTLESLLLKKKYTGIILKDEDLPRLNTVRELVTFGEIDDDTLKELLSKRVKRNKKPLENVDEVFNELKSGKRLKELGITPNFGLHSPRGGFKKSTKLPYPQGILGKNKEINKIVRRML